LADALFADERYAGVLEVAVMKYDSEADWHLLNTCNYRCSYCFFPGDILGDKLRTYADPERWGSAFDAGGWTWLLHLTGGEPSIYPDFATLCERLTKRHYISINSNLTGQSLPEFAERIDPSRVSFINAGFHPEERTRRSGRSVFLRNTELLRAKGFHVLVSVVATPLALEQFSETVELFKLLGLYPIPKLLRGMYEGHRYPEAYSELDKNRFRIFSGRARDAYKAIYPDRTEWPTVDILHDDDFLFGIPAFTGLTCDAGYRFFSIAPNGDVNRCGPVERLGNILDGTFYPRSQPAPCNTSYCFYFCKKYARFGFSAAAD
jgi:MoaA/NifB/PqqE/SkfB family radical SAM enzyme